MSLMNTIKNLIKNGRQKKIADDSGNIQKVNISSLGQVRNVKSITPYGLYCSPVLNSDWIIFSSRANTDDLQGIGNDYKNRPKDLQEGEVILKNLKTGAFIKFDASGNIEISTDKDIIAQCDKATVTATEINVTCPVTNITGDVNIDGNLDVTGTVTYAGIVANTHRHAPSSTPPSNP